MSLATVADPILSYPDSFFLTCHLQLHTAGGCGSVFGGFLQHRESTCPVAGKKYRELMLPRSRLQQVIQEMDAKYPAGCPFCGLTWRRGPEVPRWTEASCTRRWPAHQCDLYRFPSCSDLPTFLLCLGIASQTNWTQILVSGFTLGEPKTTS